MPQLHNLSDPPILRGQERRLGERAKFQQIGAAIAIAEAIERDDIALLMDMGASVVLPFLAKIEGFGRRDAKGRSVLMRAARRSEPGVLAWLVEKGDPKAMDEESRTALMWAASHGNAPGVELLLPVSDAHAACERGNTALIWAAAGNGPGHALCVALLAPKSDAMATNAMGHDALWEAIQCGSVNSAQTLAKKIDWPARKALRLDAMAQCAQCGAFAVFNALEKTVSPAAEADAITASRPKEL